MKNIDVIVLTGKKFSGKDTLAAVIKDRQRVAFGDQHKRVCAELFPFMEMDYESDQKELPILPGGLSPREVWTQMNILTKIYPGFNTSRLHQELIVRSSTQTNFVVTDLRQRCELDWVQEMGYPIVKIVDMTDRSHIVEDELEEFVDKIQTPYQFHNYKTEDCKRKFREFVQQNFPS